MAVHLTLGKFTWRLCDDRGSSMGQPRMPKNLHMVCVYWAKLMVSYRRTCKWWTARPCVWTSSCLPHRSWCRGPGRGLGKEFWWPWHRRRWVRQTWPVVVYHHVILHFDFILDIFALLALSNSTVPSCASKLKGAPSPHSRSPLQLVSLHTMFPLSPWLLFLYV